MHSTYLLLGGNLGDRLGNLNKTLLLIEKFTGRIMFSSSVYETTPWGFESENMFLNKVVCVETPESPRDLLSNIMKIETMMGRKRKANQIDDRIIDIDILFYDALVLNEADLNIPHQYLHLRRFALLPLAEIAGEMIHPGFKKTINTLLEECGDDLKVNVFEF